MVVTKQTAERIAQKSGPKVGFAWIMLIPIIMDLIPMIVKCFQPDDPAQAKKYLNKRYDAANNTDKYGGFKKNLVIDVARRAKRAAKKKGESLTMDQAIAVAVDTLEDTRTSDDSVVGACITESDVLIASGAVTD